MTLFIQINAGTPGDSGDVVFPAHASLDLIQIAGADLGYGEQPTDTNLLEVTYERTAAGPCPERLDELVNTSFHVNEEGIDIIVIAVGSGFTLADGTLVAGTGIVRAPSTAGNPTASVLVFYDVQDNNGDGVCLNAQDNGQYDLSNPSSALLYHELSHALRHAKKELLSLMTSDPCSNASPEEKAAIVDENDLRAQLGERLRTTTNHCGNAGLDGACATSSCVVATVATGSPYSAEVCALRRIRDGLLRRSEIGFDFFSHLHDDYYGFSPEICRLMASSAELLPKIRGYFVGPLTACLELLVAYTLDTATAEELGRRTIERVKETRELWRLTAEDLAVAEALLDGRPVPALPGLPALHELTALLHERARSSAFVQWALFEPIRMIIHALRQVRMNMAPAAIGTRLAKVFDAWAVELPLTPVWHGLSRYAIAQELEFLGGALVRTPAARHQLRARVLAHMGERPDVAELFDAAWGVPGEDRS